jgi:hypothetical protein
MLRTDNDKDNDSYIPTEIYVKIGSFLENADNSSKSAYARTCKTIYQFFQPHLDNLAQSLVQELLQHAINGRQADVLKMLNKNPGLITKSGIVVGHNNCILKGTVFKILLRINSVMYKSIEHYFDYIKNGKKEKTKQIEEQFPDTYDPESRIRYDFNALIQVLANDTLISKIDLTARSQTYQALQDFQKYFLSQLKIPTGIHFDMHFYLDAIKAYKENIHILNSAQRAFYCIKVKGFLQSFFPVDVAKLICKGIGSVINNLETIDYSELNTKLSDGTDFYTPELGHSHFVCVYEIGCGKSFLACSKQSIQKEYEWFSKLCEMHISLQEYVSSNKEKTLSCCCGLF